MAHERASCTLLKVVTFASRRFSTLFVVLSSLALRVVFYYIHPKVYKLGQPLRDPLLGAEGQQRHRGRRKCAGKGAASSLALRGAEGRLSSTASPCANLAEVVLLHILEEFEASEIKSRSTEHRAANGEAKAHGRRSAAASTERHAHQQKRQHP